MKNKKNYKLKFILGLLIIIILSFFFFLFSPLPQNSQKPSWFFYDKYGEILYQQKNINPIIKRGLGGVTIKNNFELEIQLNSRKNLENLFFTKALILLEDENFQTHHGVNFLALLRATKQNIFEKKIISGASTITMQLAKILYLPNQKHDFIYKIKQIFYALKLEIKFSKTEILQKYLENIAFGNNTNGLVEASQKYFSKLPENLSVGESLTLLSTIQNPSLFNPLNNPKNNLNRRKKLLNRLVEKNLLTEKEKIFWETQYIPLNISINNQIVAPHFVFWVQKQIQNSFLFQELKKSPEIHVYTTLDKKKYATSLHITKNILKNLKEKNIHNASIVALNKNQELEVMLGSPNFFDKSIDGAVNLATSLRQTGSILKPFLYTLALENNFSPLFILRDEKQIFESGYFPRNFNINEFNGKVYFREALVNSYNIAAVYLLTKVGLHPFFNFTQRLGLNFQKSADELGESFILGSGSESLLNITKAYSVFKNKGEFHSIKFFTKIKNQKNQEIFSWQDFCKKQYNCKPQKIISKNSSEWIIHALSDQKSRWKNFEKGNPLELSFPTAVKTGTSQNFVDNWVIGFSSQKTIGVWMGNADGTPLHSSSGIEGSGPLWHKIMTSLHKNFNNIKFNYTGTREEKIICRDPEKKNIKTCSELFTAFLTPEEILEYKEKSVSLRQTQNKGEEEDFEIIYPVSGSIFRRNTDILIQTNFKNKSQNLEYFLNNQKINTPIIKNLKSGKYQIKVLNKKSHETHEISIEVK